MIIGRLTRLVPSTPRHFRANTHSWWSTTWWRSGSNWSFAVAKQLRLVFFVRESVVVHETSDTVWSGSTPLDCRPLTFLNSACKQPDVSRAPRRCACVWWGHSGGFGREGDNRIRVVPFIQNNFYTLYIFGYPYPFSEMGNTHTVIELGWVLIVLTCLAACDTDVVVL